MVRAHEYTCVFVQVKHPLVISLCYNYRHSHLLEKFTILRWANKEECIYIRARASVHTHVWFISWVKFGKKVSGTFRHRDVLLRIHRFPDSTISTTKTQYSRACIRARVVKVKDESPWCPRSRPDSLIRKLHAECYGPTSFFVRRRGIGIFLVLKVKMAK